MNYGPSEIEQSPNQIDHSANITQTIAKVYRAIQKLHFIQNIANKYKHHACKSGDTKHSIAHSNNSDLPLKNEMWPSPITSKDDGSLIVPENGFFSLRTKYSSPFKSSKIEGDHISISLIKPKQSNCKKFLRVPQVNSFSVADKSPYYFKIDIFVNAATKIQSVDRGYRSRVTECNIKYWKISSNRIAKAYRKHKNRQYIRISVRAFNRSLK
jgi:hypothetical protein